MKAERDARRQETRRKWQWNPTHPFARRWYFWTTTLLLCTLIGLTIGFGGTYLLKTFLI